VKKISLNLIDRAVALVNPQAGVERAIARAKLTHFNYDATKYNRERKGPSVLQGAESYRTGYDRIELMKRSRDLAENVGLVRSILMKFASHTAANVSYQARTSEPAVNTDVESFWSEWWDNCDISTRHTGSTLMQVAVMSMLRDGDFLFVLIRDNNGDLKLQGIEADRLGNPFQVYTTSDLIGGIHIDQETGAPTAYDIFARSIGNAYTFQQKVSASQAFHLYDPLRIDQYRGISAFHTAINDAQDIYDIINFEKMSAKVASSQSAIVLRNNNNASDLSDLTSDTNFDNQAIKLETMESGKVSYLEPGETIQFPDGPNRPSGAFAEFHKILLRNICLGVGIPYSFAVDPSAMSGPTARLEMQQAGRTFRRYQKLLDDKVLRPIKNIVIADAVARGLIENNAGSRTTKGIFNFGANVSIDLGRESASAISEFKTGLRTAADIYAERGQDFESAMRQRAIEAKLIKDLAQKYGVAPETISDIVTPTPPQPQFPTPAPQAVATKNDKPEEGEDEGGGDEATPEEPIEPSSEELQKDDREDELPIDESEIELPTQKKSKELEDCGTGSGGFKPGNTCSGGGDGGEVGGGKPSIKNAKVEIAPEVLPGQKWGDNGQEFTEDGRGVRAKIGDFTITDAEGGLQKGAPGAVKRLGKKTKADLEKALSEPETIEAMRTAGIDNIEVRGTSKTPSGFTYYGAHNKNNLIIHTKTSEAIAASGDEYRVKHGFNRLIHHEIGHGIWDGAKEETKGNFTQAIKANPKVIEEVAKRTRIKYSIGEVWDESTADRTVTESFAELNGMKRFDKEGYSKLPQNIKDSIDGVEKEAKELRASLVKRGRIGPVKKTFKSLDCGTGSGGFKDGNTCAGGEGEEKIDKSNKASTKSPELWKLTKKEFFHPQISRKFIDAENQKDGTIIGNVGDLIHGEKTRELLKPVLDVPVMVMRTPVVKGERIKTGEDFVFDGASGTFEGKPAIFINPNSQMVGTLYEESAHQMRRATGREIKKADIKKIISGDGDFNKMYENDPEEISAKRMAKYIGTLASKEKDHEEIVRDALKAGKKVPQNVLKEYNLSTETAVVRELNQNEIKMLIAGMMGGIELGKYEGIDFSPPQGARDAAKRALEVRETKPPSQRGMTPVGLARARDLQNGVKLSPDTIKRMKAFFDRHEVDKKGSTFGEQGKGWQAWNGWGGDAGYSWAKKVVGQMESRDKKELAEPASCPIATQDVKTNLANRQTAVDDANYGPANPNEPNEDYWKAKAGEFQGDVPTAKKMLCGNCAAFDQRNKILGCIKKGIGEDANEVAIGGDLGYCEIFDFKCASKRTCDAWIVGGPITDKKEELARPVSQTPAPPKERIKGSKENPEGTASTRSKAGDIEISEQNEEALKNKIAEFKKDHPNKNAPSIGALKKVFRRGAGAFSTSFRPTISGGKPNSRNAWAMARVNKFLKMAGGGEVKKSYREADGDLL